MHDVLFFESFFFCSRDDLEHLQPISRLLLNMIVNGSRVLPLRPIYCVDMDSDDDVKDTIQIFVKKPAAGGAPGAYYKASVRDGDFAETCRRLQYTCVECFWVGFRESPFLRYWKAEETVAFTVVTIEFYLPGTTDYDALDSIVNHLRPKAMEVEVSESSWHEDGDKREWVQILARDSLLRNLHTCRLDVRGSGSFPPPAFFLTGPGYPNYEVKCFESNELDVIDGFIESFVRDGCTNNKLHSVCVLWHPTVLSAEDQPRMPRMPKQLTNPTKTDLPLPNAEMIKDSIPAAHQVLKCEMYSFVNTKQWQRMDVYKCGPVYILHETYILQCRVKSL